MREVVIVHRAIPLAGVLLALTIGGITLRQGGTFPALASTSATPAPCLVDRDVPYYGGAAPVIARPPASPRSQAPPPPPNPAMPPPPDDRHIPPRPPRQHPCQVQLLDERATP